MNERIAGLRNKVLVSEYPLCVEKACLVIDSFKQTEGQPKILQIAQAFAHYLDNRTIFIEDNELIVGNVASKPMGFEADHMDQTWPHEDMMELRKKGLSISDEDEVRLRAAVDTFYENKGRTFIEAQARLIDDERLWPFMQSGIMLPPWQKSKAEGFGHGGAGMSWSVGNFRGISVPDFAMALENGIDGLTRLAEEELRNTRIMGTEAIDKIHFLQAVIIANKAVVRIANRFADLTADMSKKEKNPLRKKELDKISETCRWVPANRPRTFFEAIQFFWFIWVSLSGGTTGGGRFDQFMYPFYKKDKDAGKLSDTEATELIELLRIKIMQTNCIFGGKIQRDKWAGFARWNNFIIGGLTPEGKDATNELSYLLLDAAMDCQTPHFTMSLRVHEGTPEPLMLKAIECLKTGIGMPAFLGDKSYMEYFLSRGVSLTDARDYVVGGCLDSNIPGRSGIAGAHMFVVPLVFEMVMNNGIEKRTGRPLGPKTGEFSSFKTYEELYDAVKKQMIYFLGIGSEYDNIWTGANIGLNPDPFASQLYWDSLKVGKDTFTRTLKFENGMTLNPVGMINVVNSLAALKKLVFIDKKYSLKEIKDAIDSNWDGEKNEKIRKECLAAPKYGNGDIFVDSIATDLYKLYADEIVNYDTVFGGKIQPGGVSITSHGPAGALTGATPDGRYAGQNLADGTMSPAQGTDAKGPLAVVTSAWTIDQIPWSSTLMNMKFHPSALKTTDDMRKLSALIKTYFSMGGKHMQFNVVGRETLMDAQKQPEKHRDLIVRVAGYSAYFVQLTKAIQDDVMARAEQQLKN